MNDPTAKRPQISATEHANSPADNLASWNGVRLSIALASCTQVVTLPQADITHGTSFIRPVNTLLAGLLGTKRADLVMQIWPILGCEYRFYEDTLRDLWFYVRDQRSSNRSRIDIKELLDTKMLQDVNHRPTVLHELIDFLQGSAGWKLDQIIPWVKAVEDIMRYKDHIVVQLQAYADEAVERNNRSGVLGNAPQLSEGFVIPVEGIGGKGRVN